jgi:hypothetical protein
MSGLALTGTFAPSLGLARARSRSTTSRARGMTVFTKGKGSRYRNDLADPYQATKTSAEKAAKKAPKQTADRGPINVTFDAGDDTEEYFLFVRKVRGDGDQDATKDASASSASSSSKAASAEIAAALGMKPNDAVPAVASIGAWLPLGDVVMEAGADLDVVVAERREILTSFAKRKHLKLLPILDDERLEWGARAQRGKSRGSDPTAVFRVADAPEHEALVWDHEKMGEEGAHRAELRLMQALPSLGKGQKSEMLNSAMDVIKAQQQKAEEIRRKNEQQNA